MHAYVLAAMDIGVDKITGLESVHALASHEIAARKAERVNIRPAAPPPSDSGHREYDHR